MIGLARLAAPIACIGLAVLLMARTRQNRIAGLAYAAVGTALLAEARGWGLFQALEAPTWLSIAASVILLDLAIYLQHVLFHAVPVLWRLHRMHHAYSDTEQDPHSPRIAGNPVKMMNRTRDIYRDINAGRFPVEARFDGGYPSWPALDRFASRWLSSVTWGVLYLGFYFVFATAAWQFLLLPLFVLLFAWIYLTMSRSSPAAFDETLTRSSSLYFTVTVLSTVGFGDIVAKTETARLVTAVQMVCDLTLLAVVVRLIFDAASRATTGPGVPPKTNRESE